MQNFLDKILEGNRLKIIGIGIIIFGIIFSIIIFSNDKKTKNNQSLNEDEQFNLALAADIIGAELGLVDNVNEDEEKKDYAHDSSQNMTKDLTTNLMYANAYLIDNGFTSTNTQIAIMSNIGKKYIENIKNNEYKKTDLNILKNPTTDDLNQFANSFLNNLQNYNNQLNKVDKSDLESFIKINEIMEKSLLSVNVPEEISQDYLNLINSFYRNAAYTLAVKDYENDPLKLNVFKDYTIKNNFKLFESSVINIKNYLSNKIKQSKK